MVFGLMRRALVGLLLLSFVFAAMPTAEPAPPSWTFLVYMAGDNNLETVAVDDFLEMSSVGSTDDLQIVVQFDRHPAESRDYEDWTTTKRFHITEGMLPIPANELSDLGEMNMAEPQTLIDFVVWGMTAYPADRYFLDLWDHGIGWAGVILDRNDTRDDFLTTAELRSALDRITEVTGNRIDILGNDACRMTLEIMYELQDYVDVFVGSEKDEPLDGWPYDTLLTRLANDPGMLPIEVASHLVDVYVESYVDVSAYSVTLSAVSSDALPALADALHAFSAEMISHLPYFTQAIHDARAATEHYEVAGNAGGDEYDLYHLTETVSAEVGSPRLTRMAGDLAGAIENAVAHEAHWDNPAAVNGVPAKNAHGLAIFFPSNFPSFSYRDLAISNDTDWDEFLMAYGGAPRVAYALVTNVTVEDIDEDGLDERIVVNAIPGVNGTVALELTGPFGYIERMSEAVAGEPVQLTAVPTRPGAYEIAAYLFESGRVRNLTFLEPAAVEAVRTFEGTVTLNGSAVDGLVHIRNPRTEAVYTTALTDGEFSLELIYPTDVQHLEPLEFSVIVDGRELTFLVAPDLRAPTQPFTIAFPSAVPIQESGPDFLMLSLGLLIGAVIATLAFIALSMQKRRRTDRLLKE
jgi:hypothetical protein